MLAHSVYFSLADNSPAGVQRQIDACQKYLTGHDGVTFFGVGTLTPDLAREVNVRDFDVALLVVFADRAAHDRYQTHPRHLEFIAENKAGWTQVRVFDADLA